MSELWIADADSHLYETRDAFTRYLEPRHAHLGIRVVTDDDGNDAILVGDRPFTFLKPLYDQAPVPGTLREVLHSLSSGTITDVRLEGPVEPEFVDPKARLAWMDDHHVELAVVVPSLGGTVEVFMQDNPQQTALNLHAFNQWLEDEWGFATGSTTGSAAGSAGATHRLYTTPMVSLLDLDAAVQEVEWLSGRGARFLHLRPGPAGRRSPADPVFDPFWARVEEAGMIVVLHISESGYNEMVSAAWSEDPHPSSWNISAFQWTATYGDRPIMDTVTAMIMHNLFGRFPRLQMMSLENGSLWVPYLLAAMDKMKGMGRNSPWLGGRVEGRPSEIFRQHFHVSPFHEEQIGPLVAAVGVERVLFGSDYPHPEGVADPIDYLHALDVLSDDAVRMVMGDNLRDLLARTAP